MKCAFFKSNFKDFPCTGTESFLAWIRIRAVFSRIRIEFVQILDSDPYQNDMDPQH